MKGARLIVVGGGPVGLSLACAARGIEATVVEAAERARADGDAFDHRIFALSPGTRGFLREIGAWERLDATRIAAISRMEVHGDAGGKLAFGGRGNAPLAWTVEAGRLLQAIRAQADSLDGTRMVTGEVTSCGAGAAGAWVELAGGERLEGDLLVGADGPDSTVRRLAGLPAHEQRYDEEALVANFETERAHGDVARQWFRRDGVLAWLPLPGKRISIVWSARGTLAGDLAGLDDAQLARRVRDAGGCELGELILASPVARFPLRAIRVERTVAPGLALVGDAAHVVHPLAGQGVNLGFQDARLLAEEVSSRSPLERPGELRVLRRFARARREDVTAMQFITDSLDRLFGSESPGASGLRNAGMGLVQSQSWIRALLAERAMR